MANVPTASQGDILLTLSGQQLHYGQTRVLRDISLSLHSGERIALVGESGAGKSTLLKLLREQLDDQVAYCPQQLGLVEPLSVFHNIYMGRLDRYGLLANLRNLIKPTTERVTEISELATVLGLENLLFRSVDQLSGGQQQRTALGRALYQQRRIFIGDEPVSSVDEYQAEQLLTLVNQRHDTVVMALHDQQLALQHFQRIIGLRDGTVVMDAPAQSVAPADLAALYC